MNLLPLDRLGKPGIAGLGLLLFCLSFYLGNLAPARSELANLKPEAARLAAAPAGGQGDAAGPAKVGLPPFTTATEAQKELAALAERHGVNIERSTYLLSDQDGRRRLEVNLPLKAGYASLRSYLRDVLAQPAGPTLDELVLQRQKASDEVIEANVRLSYYFAPSP